MSASFTPSEPTSSGFFPRALADIIDIFSSSRACRDPRRLRGSSAKSVKDALASLLLADCSQFPGWSSGWSRRRLFISTTYEASMIGISTVPSGDCRGSSIPCRRIPSARDLKSSSAHMRRSARCSNVRPYFQTAQIIFSFSFGWLADAYHSLEGQEILP